jgi:hypothetical protein
MKTFLQWLLFPIAVALGGEFVAVEGTPTYRFLMWLYGPEAISESAEI